MIWIHEICSFQEVISVNYEDLENKPSINGVTLEEGMELEDIGITELTPDMVSEIFLEVFGVIL